MAITSILTLNLLYLIDIIFTFYTSLPSQLSSGLFAGASSTSQLASASNASLVSSQIGLQTGLITSQTGS